MRSAMTTLFAAAVTATLLVGCAGSGGLDGDLTDDWAALPPPSAFTPAAGVCQAADFTDVVTLAAYEPVDCAGPHRVETVHVGAFPAERASRPGGWLGRAAGRVRRVRHPRDRLRGRRMAGRSAAAVRGVALRAGLGGWLPLVPVRSDGADHRGGGAHAWSSGRAACGTR